MKTNTLKPNNTQDLNLHCFGDTLVGLRKIRKITDEDLSLKTNIPFDIIKQLESGKLFPNFKIITKLADFFKVNLNFFDTSLTTDNYISNYKILSDLVAQVQNNKYSKVKTEDIECTTRLRNFLISQKIKNVGELYFEYMSGLLFPEGVHYPYVGKGMKEELKMVIKWYGFNIK